MPGEEVKRNAVDRLRVRMLYQTMRRERILGQYFTPEPVVELCYRMLRAVDPYTQNPRIVDPACGDGAFLVHALEHGITTSDRLFGMEKDPKLAAAWEARSLAGHINLLIGDGLLPHGKCEIRNPKSETNPKSENNESGKPFLQFSSSPLPITYDWVVGNPPFGMRNWQSPEYPLELIKAIRERFTIWRWRDRKSFNLARYPIEMLFLERFCQLMRPGGCAAIILPDGILANERLAYVRDWLARCARVNAVVSLPQYTFYQAGADSKASILIFRRISDSMPAESPELQRHEEHHDHSTLDAHGSIFMAALETREPVHNGIEGLPSLFADCADASGRTIASPVKRVDDDPQPVIENVKYARPWAAFTVSGLRPDARLDPAYYHPKYMENLRMLGRLPNAVELGDLIGYTTYGQVGPREYADSGVRLLTPANLVVTKEGFVTGVDVRSPERFVSPGHRNDPVRSRLRKGDLLLANSGVGCIGRPAVFYSDELCNISQHLNLIRLIDVEPEYLAVYLQTRFARLQIHREKCGVGPCGINFQRIKSILVRLLPESSRREIVEGYRRLALANDPDRLIRELVLKMEESIVEEIES